MTIVISCEELSKSYQDKKALDNLSLGIEKGQITAVLGRNGSGKTTLIKLLLNMIAPSSGQIKYDNIPVSQLGHRLYLRTAAILESVDNLYDYMTGKENIDYFSGLQGQKRAFSSPKVQSLITRLKLEGAIHQPCGDYSRGMKQKLALIIALVSDANILFLDEPTLGLDFESCRLISDTLRWLSQEEGKTILLTSHQADLIDELADKVVLLDRGRLLFSGDLQDFKSKNKDRSHYVVTCKPGDFDKSQSSEKDENYQFFFDNHQSLAEWLAGQSTFLPYIYRIEETNQKIDDVLERFYGELADD